MSNITQIKESIKKKMLLKHYEEIPQNTDTSSHQEAKTPSSVKVKQTIYLDQEQWLMFNELCLDEMKRSGKPEKSKILGNAIENLYKMLKQH